MAHQTQHIFRYQSFHINKSQPLGHGAYGAVYNAKCDQLPCAAKVLHPTILDPTDPGAGKIMNRFQQECTFLESIRHPNIVQYLGMTRDPESRLPVLLMELLGESLTKMLEHSQQSLAYCIQVDICHDIALAVAYLHSNDIIHRDLSSNNVLMIAGRRAKVTDFGMSKLVGVAPSMTPLTMCPGTLAYMPPEALREPPRYTKNLDCFSEGVIMIQVCTRLWPEPGPRTQVVEDSRSPMGVIEIPVSEYDRRKNHIDLIDPDHALLLIAKDCIRFQDKDRPSSEELCLRMADLKESAEYTESTHQIRDQVQINNDRVLLLTQQLQEKDRRIHEMDDVISAKNQQVQDAQSTLQQKDNEIEERDWLLQQKERQLQEERESQRRQLQEERALQERRLQEESALHEGRLQEERVLKERRLQEERALHEGRLQEERVLKERRLQEERALHEGRLQEERASRERQLRQLNQQLEEQELVTAEIQQANYSLQRQVEQLQQQLSQSLSSSQPPPSQAQVGGRQLQEKESWKLLTVQPPLQVHHKPHPHRVRRMKLNWRDGGKAPLEMSRGAAAVDGDMAYFMTLDGEVCSYNVSSKKWSKFSRCPYCYSSLAVINSQVTAIGGCMDVYNKDTYTNKLLSLPDYEAVFPHMPTKRGDTTAVTTIEHLIVAGGAIGCTDRLKVVEVMDTRALVWSTVANLPNRSSNYLPLSNTINTIKMMDTDKSTSLVWSTVACLPHSYSDASGIVYGDHLYMLGGVGENGLTKSVLTCSLTELLQSSSSSTSVWHRVADAPVYSST